MKKVIAAALTVIIVLVALCLSGCTSGGSGEYINVYNWGEYISDGSDGTLDINAEFERRTGIRVNYTNYASNEDLYGKLKSGGASYDIIIPSDYMIERMINEDMLQKLDFGNIPNYTNIADQYKNLFFDPENEYSVPYNVGTVGLIYNTKLIEEAPTSWSALWDERYADEILMFNNPRDTFAIAQFLLGIDINTTSQSDWDRVAAKINEQKPLVQSYVMDEIYNKMESGEAALAPYYAGDFLSMQENNPDLAIVFPSEGTNIFVDSICIPVGAQNKTGAEQYINFLLEPDIALASAEYLYYTSPNTTVLENEEYSLLGNEIVYPSEDVISKTEYFHNLPSDTLTYMSNLWDDLKISGSDNTGIYIGLGCAVLIIAGYFVFRAIRKKSRGKYM